ncbi:hypothetical protein D3C86_1098770 [compost metagenome]
MPSFRELFRMRELCRNGLKGIQRYSLIDDCNLIFCFLNTIKICKFFPFRYKKID